MRQAIRREAEAQARIRQKDVERRRKARERMSRAPAILSMDDFDLGPSVVQSDQSPFNLQKTLDRMQKMYPNRRRRMSPPKVDLLVTKEFQEMTDRFERQDRENRKRLKDRMRRVKKGTKNVRKVDKNAIRKIKKKREKTMMERMQDEKRPRQIGEVGWEGVRRKDTSAIPRVVRITGLGSDISGNPIVYFKAQGGGSSQMSLEKFERDFQTLEEYLEEYDAGLKKKKKRKKTGRKPMSPRRSAFKIGDVVEKVKGAGKGKLVRITQVSGSKIAGEFEEDGKKVRLQSASNFR
jgi:hypothetical protein